VASSADLENAIADIPSFLLSGASMADCVADLYRIHPDDPTHLLAARRRREADFCWATRLGQGIYYVRKS
jgi:hypothetical protein